ncbi:hypothetical protein [Vibrio coralliilyticus]|uniref:hypothetical protein n=1 Tax=Vibrio coralliilyticus TaxID=190893 RepID=UPI002FD46E53
MKISLIAIAVTSIVTSSAHALQTEQDFLNNVDPQHVSERNADGSYNFDRKDIYTIVHDDGTVEYPLLNSGKLIRTRTQATAEPSQFSAYSSSDSTAQSDRIVQELSIHLDHDPTPIDITQEGAPANSEYHPLRDQMVKVNGQEYFRISDTDELLFRQGRKQYLFTSGEPNSTLLPLRYTGGLSATTVVDANSDGIEEPISVTQRGTSRDIEYQSNLIGFGGFAEPTRTWNFNNSFVKAIGGDFNGDNIKDELIVAYNGVIDLYRKSASSNNWEHIHQYNPWSKLDKRSWNLSIDAKDIDGIPGLEVVAMYSPQESYNNTNENVRGRYELYRYDNDQVETIIGSNESGVFDPYFNPTAEHNRHIIPTDVKLAQLRPGGAYEIVATGHYSYASRWESMVLESAVIDLVNPNGATISNHTRNYWDSPIYAMDYRPQMTIWDASESGDWVVVDGNIFRRGINENNQPVHISQTTFQDRPQNAVLKAEVANFKHENEKEKDYPELYYVWVDKNDGRILGNQYTSVELTDQGNFSFWRHSILDDELVVGEAYPYIDLQAINYHSDEDIAVYDGHELRYSEPTVYAMLASVPYYTGQTNPSSASGTTLELGKNSGTSDEIGSVQGWGSDFGFNVSASGGFIGQAKVETSVTTSISQENAQAYLKESSKEIGIGFNGSLGEEIVLISVAAADHYFYSVVKSTDMNASISGDADFVIDVPRPSRFASLTLDYLKSQDLTNQYINIAQLDSALGYTRGVPSSYMNKYDALQKIQEMQETGDVITYQGEGTYLAEVHQGQGTATNFMSINYEDGSANVKGFTQTVGNSVEVGFGAKVDVPLFAEAEFGISISHGGWGAISSSQTVSAGESSRIEGNVPHLNDDDIDSGLRPFTWGILGYTLDLSQDGSELENKALLVTYWVE